MKIVAGLGNIEDYESFAEAGADELFAGYVPYEWQRFHELSTPANRREVLFSNVSLGGENELKILREKIEKKKVYVTIAFNALNYRPQQYPILANIMENCYRLGYERFIVGDLGLLIYLQKTGFSKKAKIHVSGEFGEMNIYQIKYLSEYGIDRIIYHRGTHLEDMRQMIQAFQGLSHEAFFMNEKCQFTGAYCNSLHCDEMVPMCRMPYLLKNKKSTIGKQHEAEDHKTSIVINNDYMEKNRSSTEKIKGETQRAIAQIEEYQDEKESDKAKTEAVMLTGMETYEKLKSIGVTHLKIVGRGASTEDMLRDIKNAAAIRAHFEAGEKYLCEGDFYKY